MEMVIFHWNAEDKSGQESDADVSISISNEEEITREEICYSFVKFLAAAGYSTEGLSKEFKD